MKNQIQWLRDIEAKQARTVVSEYGHVDSCDWETLGDSLTADALTGATVLHVVDTCDLDEEPDGGHGWLLVDDTHLLRYTTCDGDPESPDPTVTLLDPLPADVDEGAPVHLWDPRLEAVVTEMIAMVAIDGDDEGELVEATVAADLIDQLAAGPRDLNGESVRLEVEDHEWRIVDVEGGAGRAALGESTGPKFHNTDTHIVIAPGEQAPILTHEPIPGSEHLYWNGLHQPPSEWTRTRAVVTVPDAAGLIEVDDEITVSYSYLATGASGSFVDLIPFAAAGWRYLEVAQGDAADYSAAAFDDSAWATGTAPFGNSGSSDVPTHTTLWNGDKDLWLRMDFPAGQNVTVVLPVEDNAEVWVNGVSVGTIPAAGPGESNITSQPTLTVPPGALNPAGNVIAIRAKNETGVPVADPTYVDVNVQGVN